MQFTQKSKDHMDACRFCWMCRHICPVGNATGQERNTARARALGLSMVAREAIEYSEDIINNVYECALCGACVEDCVTGWDPVMFTKEARQLAALEGKLPSYILKMLDNLDEKGNVYGLDKDKALTDAANALGSSKTLLFIGEDASFKAPSKAIKAIELLQKAGVDFTALADEPNSGASINFIISAVAETKAVMENAAKALASYDKIICYDPADAKLFKREYKEWGIELGAEIVTFTEFVASLIKDGKLTVKKSDIDFTPQDSYLLARELEECAPVREILSACGNVKEMLLNCKATVLAGNLIMNEYMPEIMKDVASRRWINAENMNCKTVVTESPAEYVLMKETKPEGMEILTVEEAVLKCL